MGKRTEHVIRVLLHFFWAPLTSRSLEALRFVLPVQPQPRNEIGITLVFLVTRLIAPLVAPLVAPIVAIGFALGITRFFVLLSRQPFCIVDYVHLLAGTFTFVFLALIILIPRKPLSILFVLL